MPDPTLTKDSLMTGEELIEYGFDPAVLREWLLITTTWLDTNYPPPPTGP